MEKDIKSMFSNFAVQIEKDVKYGNYSDKELLNKWTSILLSLNDENRKDNIKLTFKELYFETILAASDKTQKNTLQEAIPTGFVDLDRIIIGLPLGELIIVGARPSMGKTAFLIDIMANIIADKNLPVAYFSLENNAQNILLRLLSTVSELSYTSIVSRHLKPIEVQQLVQKTKIVENANLTIEDNCLALDDIITEAYFLIKEKGVKLIIVDYLQMIQVRGKAYREQEIAKICRELKAFAKQYNVAVLVSSQLSRAVETRGGDKKPQLSDLRDSGTIEQDADKVLFIHRPEYYNITEDYEGNSTIGIAEIIVAKNRAGILDSAKLQFIRHFPKFKNLEYTQKTMEEKPSDVFQHMRRNEFDQEFNTTKSDIEEEHPF